VRARGFPKDAKGNVDTNLPPESVYYEGAAISINRPFQPGWAYKVKFHTGEGTPSIGATLGLESSGKDLVSDWIELTSATKSATNSWVPIDSLHGPSLTLDIRNAQGGGSNLGIDYNLRLFSYDPVRFPVGQSAIAGLGVKAGSKGYLKNEGSSKVDPKLDSVISTFDGYLDLLLAPKNRLATFLTPQLSFKNEANQNFTTSTYTFGGGTSFDLGFLFPLNRADSPSWLQRINFMDLAQTRRPIDAPRFYAGYDRVFNANSSNRSSTTGDASSEFNRLTYGAAWGLPVLNERTYVTMTWQGYQDLDAPRNSFHSLTEIALTYALTDPRADNKAPVNLLLKYINGSLPPNFGTESGITAGLSISLK
jgi:hypothetical protein